jgi:hypothetical protein
VRRLRTSGWSLTDRSRRPRSIARLIDANAFPKKIESMPADEGGGHLLDVLLPPTVAEKGGADLYQATDLPMPGQCG